VPPCPPCPALGAEEGRVDGPAEEIVGIDIDDPSPSQAPSGGHDNSVLKDRYKSQDDPHPQE
jgi:hypothetical protein